MKKWEIECQCKFNHKGLTPQVGISPYLLPSKKTSPDSNDIGISTQGG